MSYNFGRDFQIPDSLNWGVRWEKKTEGEMKRLQETGKVRGRQLMKRFRLHSQIWGEMEVCRRE